MKDLGALEMRYPRYYKQYSYNTRDVWQPNGTWQENTESQIYDYQHGNIKVETLVDITDPKNDQRPTETGEQHRENTYMKDLLSLDEINDRLICPENSTATCQASQLPFYSLPGGPSLRNTEEHHYPENICTTDLIALVECRGNPENNELPGATMKHVLWQSTEDASTKPDTDSILDSPTDFFYPSWPAPWNQTR